MWSEKSTSRCTTERQVRVRRPALPVTSRNVSLKRLKHPSLALIWGCYSGECGRAALFNLPKNVTVNSSICTKVLRNPVPTSFDIQKCTFSCMTMLQPVRPIKCLISFRIVMCKCLTGLTNLQISTVGPTLKESYITVKHLEYHASGFFDQWYQGFEESLKSSHRKSNGGDHCSSHRLPRSLPAFTFTEAGHAGQFIYQELGEEGHEGALNTGHLHCRTRFAITILLLEHAARKIKDRFCLKVLSCIRCQVMEAVHRL